MDGILLYRIEVLYNKYMIIAIGPYYLYLGQVVLARNGR